MSKKLSMGPLPEFQILSVSEAKGLLQDTLDQALPVLMIEGEVSGFSISRDTFVFFDVKDSDSSLHCFMMRAGLIQPIEDGMMIRIVARPRITARGQLSLTVEAYELIGEGSLGRAFEILKAKLEKEGLFALERKRPLPPAPQKIGLVASAESAAYADFVKILNARWVGVKISHAETSVQGVRAVNEIVRAIEIINQLSEPPEVLVLTRGGGSLEDLAAFNAEPVVRAIASSRVPTLVAIGHEIDISLAELAADMRASTPSNAAELLVPDKKHAMAQLADIQKGLNNCLTQITRRENEMIEQVKNDGFKLLVSILEQAEDRLRHSKQLFEALDPILPLKKGFALVLNSRERVVSSVKSLKKDEDIRLKFVDGQASAVITKL